MPPQAARAHCACAPPVGFPPALSVPCVVTSLPLHHSNGRGGGGHDGAEGAGVAAGGAGALPALCGLGERPGAATGLGGSKRVPLGVGLAVGPAGGGSEPGLRACGQVGGG